jgi:hypothetical protein
MFFHRLLGPRPALGPSRNGSGDSASPFSSRPSFVGPSPRELALERELAALRREQAALVREEAKGRANLIALEDRLDTLANEIDTIARRTRDPGLRGNAAAMIDNVKAIATREGGVGRDTAQAVVEAIKVALGLEPSPYQFTSPRAPQATPSATAHQTTAQDIVDAGARARGAAEAPDVVTGVIRKLRSDLPPVGSAARAMLNADRKRRGLPPYGDDE